MLVFVSYCVFLRFFQFRYVQLSVTVKLVCNFTEVGSVFFSAKNKQKKINKQTKYVIKFSWIFTLFTLRDTGLLTEVVIIFRRFHRSLTERL